jgi:hypothetical protein
MDPQTLRWHEDGHELWLQLVRDELTIATVICPNVNNPDGDCHTRQASCLVTHFLDRFGLECNVGVCAPEERLEVAWTVVGDKDDLDLAQVWIIPLTDDIYASWRAEQG